MGIKFLSNILVNSSKGYTIYFTFLGILEYRQSNSVCKVQKQGQIKLIDITYGDKDRPLENPTEQGAITLICTDEYR